MICQSDMQFAVHCTCSPPPYEYHKVLQFFLCVPLDKMFMTTDRTISISAVPASFPPRGHHWPSWDAYFSFSLCRCRHQTQTLRITYLCLHQTQRTHWISKRMPLPLLPRTMDPPRAVDPCFPFSLPCLHPTTLLAPQLRHIHSD